MNKKIIMLISFIIWGTSLLIFAYFYLWSTWPLMLLIWTMIAAFIIYRELTVSLSNTYNIIFYMTIFLYPLIESGIKYMIIYNIIPYSWVYLNRIEHTLWIFCIGIIILPFFKNTIRKLNRIEAYIIFFSILMTIGIFNEFFSFSLRLYYKTNSSDHLLAAYYNDTIYDFIMNFTGSILITLLLIRKSIITNKKDDMPAI